MLFFGGEYHLKPIYLSKYYTKTAVITLNAGFTTVRQVGDSGTNSNKSSRCDKFWACLRAKE